VGARALCRVAPPALLAAAVLFAAPNLHAGDLQFPGAGDLTHQDAPRDLPDPVLEGRLYFGESPADSGTVVLHRVTPAEAGPVDSVQVDGEGRFRLRLPAVPVPGSGEVYFATSRREGILYYGEALTSAERLHEAYAVRTYPARPAPPGGLDLTVAVRNVFLEDGPLGWRVSDVLEIRNPRDVTWITEPGGEPLWRYPLPPGARAARTAPAEVNPDAVRFRDGTLEFMGPLLPGERILVIQYDVEALTFSLPLPGLTEFLEVLVRDPAPPVHPQGLASRPDVALEEGSRYLRWTGEGLQDRVVPIVEGRGVPFQWMTGWVALILALILAVVGIWAVLRGGRSPEGATGESREPQE
jgi:hypothetical protein